jgi:DNA modification methylase
VTYTLHQGDCLQVMATLEANSFDSIVCDPPYGLNFMSKDWDHGVPGVAFWAEALRVAKPGAMLLAFGGTRTFHRLTCAIEDAGWEVRDVVSWLYGSGFPKSHDISKAIDKAAGAEREVVRTPITAHSTAGKGISNELDERPWLTQARLNGYHEHAGPAPATPDAQTWHGWGTSLKPAHEPVVCAFKPLPDDTERCIIVENLSQKESQLWLLSYVSTVENPSTLSLNGQSGVLSIAQWTVAEAINIRDALRGQMDMSQFASMVNSCLSTVTSWSNTLAALWADGSTFTTSTATSPTIDLKTLRYLLSQTTAENIVQCEMQAPGLQCNALPAGAYLNAVKASISSTLMLSALENATYGERTKRLGGTADPSIAWEPVIMAMKPLDGTYADNALRWNVAGLNVDGARIATEENRDRPRGTFPHSDDSWGNGHLAFTQGNPTGRWPANLILDESAAAALDEASGERLSGGADKRNREHKKYTSSVAVRAYDNPIDYVCEPSTGGASRYFKVIEGDRMAYFPKASRRERNAGLEGMEARTDFITSGKGLGNCAVRCPEHDAPLPSGSNVYGCGCAKVYPDSGHRQPTANNHPCVKPVSLMRYLVRLTATPFGGVVLDPFMGSGTTGVACMMEGRSFVGIEREPEYLEIARRRIDAATLPLMREAAD